uniref:Myosin binding protein Ca n=1 Tax=Nothobranchius furzeri TaxID=105023 RepID=A0A8C6L070_NOTFU
KPALKWLKGKWLDLASKAGKHIQFKESYDRNTKVHMSLIKVVDADAGGYRCEVTSKDKSYSCTFEVSVQGRSGRRHLITLLSSSIQHVPHYYISDYEDAGELDFSVLLKKRNKKKLEGPKEEVDVWEILKAAKPCDYEKIAFQYGITDLRGMLTRLKKMKAESKKSDAFLKKLDAAYSADKGKTIHLSVELADPTATVKWLKNGQEIKPSAKELSGGPEHDGKSQTNYPCLPSSSLLTPMKTRWLLPKSKALNVEVFQFLAKKFTNIYFCSHSVLCLPLSSLCDLPHHHCRYVFESVGNKRSLTINKCSLSDDAAYECQVEEEKCFTEVFVKEPPVTITKQLEDVHTVVGEKVEFEVEVSEEGANVKWMKDGVELNRDTAGSRYRFKKDGRRHILIINEATKEDIGTYYAFTNGGESQAELEVEDKELEILQSIADLTVKASEQAVFKCEVSDENVTGKWFKDGVEVQASERIRISHIGRNHKLTIDEVVASDAGDYTFVPDGYALTLSAKLNFLVLVGPLSLSFKPKRSLPSPLFLFDHMKEPPKIHIDTSGCGNQNTITVVAGNKLRVDVEITGEPAPVTCWTKGDQVRSLSSVTSHTRKHVISEAEGRVRVEKEQTLSSFVIEGAEMEDEGFYTITVTNPVGEDKAEIYIKVVDVPNSPENVKCTSVGEDSATITWDPPSFDGGVPIKGYLMERKKVGTARWTKLNFDVYESNTYEAKKMIEGVLYEMRVFAVNSIGVSQPSSDSKPFMPIAPTSEPTRLVVEDVTDTTCALKWRPPERIGAGGIDGYIIEYCKEGDDQWVQANKELVEENDYRVKGLPVGEKMLFRVTAINIAGRSPPATLSQAITIRDIVENPKIRLPRNLRSKLIKLVGEKVNLVIPFQGKPRPVVTWFKDNVLMEDKSVGTRTSEVDTILFIRSAERRHSGKFTLSVQVEDMSECADIHIQVVERPGPPINVHVTDVWGFNASLEWKPPKDDGNCEIIGYTIQKCDKKSTEWFTVYEHNRRPSCTVSDLIMGNEYSFRVFSENICGLSNDPGISLMYNPKLFKEVGMNHSPKFIAPLLDRSVIAGYNTAISCAVRGYPKPKIIWMKNNITIEGDPKFLMQNNQGVLTLNIRKPGLFDGGRYSCRAVNDLGEDQVECKLEVRGTQVFMKVLKMQLALNLNPITCQVKL